MFRDRYRLYIRWGVTVFLIILLSFLCFFAMLRFNEFQNAFAAFFSVLTPVTFGVCVAYVLTPMCSMLERALGSLTRKPKTTPVRRGICVTISICFLLALLVFLIGSVIPQVIESVRMLVSNLDAYAKVVSDWSAKRLDDNQVILNIVQSMVAETEKNIKTFLNNDLIGLLISLTTSAMQVGKTLSTFIVGMIVSIYVLFARDRLVGGAKRLLYAVVKPQRANQVLGITREADRMFHGYLIGTFVDSALVGIICFIGMSIMRMPYSVLISVIVGVTNIIPYFGPFIGAIPSALLIMMIDPMQSLIFVIFILVLQQIEGNVIAPKVLGNTTGLSSLGVLISILIGGGFFGLVGMIIAVPSFGVLSLLLKRLTDQWLKKKKLPSDAADYIRLEGVDPETLLPGYADGNLRDPGADAPKARHPRR